MEKPEYVTYVESGKMEIRIDSPIPCCQTLVLGTVNGMAGRRFLVEKDGEMVMTDYARRRAEAAREALLCEVKFFVDRIDNLKGLVKDYEEFLPGAEKRIKEAQKYKGECKARFKAGQMSESEYKDVLQTVRSIYDTPVQEYNYLFHKYFPEVRDAFPTISLSFAKYIISECAGGGEAAK